MYLLMDHLYASVKFSLIVSEEYAQLRTIKLKTMTLKTDKASVDAQVTLTHNTNGTSPITSVTYNTSTGDNCAAEIFNDAEGQRVQLNMKVDPTYLYVMSDKDLDNLFTIE